MKNEIAKREETGLKPIDPAAAPELQPMEEGQPFKIPRLVLMQGNRDEINQGIVKPGDLINSLTQENYGREIQLVALCQRPHTRIRWTPRDAGGGMLCISRNKTKPSGDPGDPLESCAKCVFVKNFDAKEGCTFNDEIIALIVNDQDPNFWEPILVTADAIKPAEQGFRDILNMARYGYVKGVRIYHKSYVIKVQSATAKGFNFWKTQCSPGNNNQLLPLETVATLEAKLPFFMTAKVNAQYEETTGEDGVDPKTGAPKGW